LSTFFLIHGSWHGGWCWERVVPLLEAQGHRVLAPDLPGMGMDRTPFAEDVMEQWIAWGASLIEAQPEPVILVGHSAGGQLVSALVERVPDRVTQAIFIAAALLADGQSRAEPKFGSDELYAAMRLSDDGKAYNIDPARAHELLFHLLPPDVAAHSVARFVNEPLQPALFRLRLSAERFGRTPRAYIETTEDRAIPLSLQREMIKYWPCDRVITLPSDHAPMYSMPERLVEALNELAHVDASG
jgi:pimeloyl-ACP methyl ester carboxylesterase